MSLFGRIRTGIQVAGSVQRARWKLGCTVLNRRDYSISAPPKRFYKKTGIVRNEDGTFSVRLDQRILKTPKGNVLKVQSDLLAMALATEWESQEDEILLSTMHLTGLCNTATDNPNNFTKESILEILLNYLESDTVLFHSHIDEVYALQQKEWVPVTNWFSETFSVELKPTRELEGPIMTQEAKQAVAEQMLAKYNLPAFHGFLYGIESLKSLLLMLCCAERKLSVSQAVLLSRLEEEYQMGNWGRVEWCHDVNQLDLQARVAAALIFIHMHSLSTETQKILASKISR